MCIHDIRSATTNQLNILARHRYMEHVEMKVTIINRSNGSAMEMNFDDEEQKQRWLEINPDYDCLGPLETELPTRHVRMQNKDEEFEGWGS